MPGVPDPLYVRARAGLLDAVEALGAHLESVVLVGAQAIYVHTGDADLTVAEYTTDADFTLSPGDLADAPLVDELLQARGFTPEGNPGRWISPDGIYIDLMVPVALAGPGKRGARLGAHGKRAARRAKGLEGTLVDREKRRITSLDPTDTRTTTVWVAGPAALLVAKIHKIAELVDTQDRVRDKDALDVLRLLRAIGTEDLANGLRTLTQSPLSAEVTAEAVELLGALFGAPKSQGVLMAVRAIGEAEDPATITGSFTALVEDLLTEIGAR
jgi:hypothetical protein